MDTLIIGQGYNIKEDTSVAKELIKQFESKRYDSFTCLVAFASYGGVSALTQFINEGKQLGMNIKVILGIDQKGTSKEALEEVLSWKVNAHIYHTNSKSIFHPKVYLFENVDIFTLIVGSNNLTIPGLVQNVECSLLIKDIKSNPVHQDFYQYWKDILEGTEINLYPITQDLIDRLYKEKYILSEIERIKRYDEGSDEKHSSHSFGFNNAPIQALHYRFMPQRHVRVKTKNADETIAKTIEKSLYVDEDVLIAEIGGGPRWKQVNFPVQIFESFFGAERGNNNYSINLMNIAKDGTLGAVEKRQAVSVKSRNYRFEINCSETAGSYPNNGRPISLFIKIDSSNFLYQVLLPGDNCFDKVRDYLYSETTSAKRELKRAVVHIEAIHAIYPQLII